MAMRSLIPSLWGRAPEAGDTIGALQREVDRAFRNFGQGLPWGSEVAASGEPKLMPELDVSETDDAIEISVELPGVDPDDIDVSVTENTLRIKGQKKSSHEEKKDGEVRVTERSYGSFMRALTLPASVDPSAVDAVFDKGVLTINLPKPPEAKDSSKRISIKTVH